MQASFFQLPKVVQWMAFSWLGLAAFVVYDQSHWWDVMEDYSFGYLVPMFVAYILYDRWPKIAAYFNRLPPVRAAAPAKTSPADSAETEPAEDASPRMEPTPPVSGEASEGDAYRSSPWDRIFNIAAWMVIVGSLLFYLFGAAYRGREGHALAATMAMSMGLAGLLLAGCFLAAEETEVPARRRWLARLGFASMFVFPALIWMLSAPLFSSIQNTISTFLLNKVTIIVYHSFDILGFPIMREGSVLHLPKGQVGVEDACSGIRSLMACLFAGSFLSAVFLDKWWKKVLLVMTAMVMAFFTNILRSLFLTAWAYAYGSDAIEGFVHDAAGYAVLGLTVVILLILLPLFNLKIEFDPGKTAEEQPPAAPGNA